MTASSDAEVADLARTSLGITMHLHYGRREEAQLLLNDLAPESFALLVQTFAMLLWLTTQAGAPDASEHEVADLLRGLSMHLTDTESSTA